MFTYPIMGNSASALSPILLDNFDGPIGLLDLHTPDVNTLGNPWVRINQPLSVDGAGLVAMATNGQRHHYNIDVGASDGVITATGLGVWRHGSSSPWAWSGVGFRTVGDRDLWFCAALTHVDPYEFFIGKCVNQVIDQAVVYAAQTAGTNVDGRGTLITYDATITLSGDDIRLEVPAYGVDLQVNDSFNNTATNITLAGKWFNNNFCTWESLEMVT